MSENTAPKSEDSIDDLGDPDATAKLQEKASANDTDSNNETTDGTAVNGEEA